MSRSFPFFRQTNRRAKRSASVHTERSHIRTGLEVLETRLMLDGATPGMPLPAILPFSDHSFQRTLQGDATLSPDGVLTLDEDDFMVMPHDASLDNLGNGNFTIGIRAQFLRAPGNSEMLVAKKLDNPTRQGFFIRRLANGHIQGDLTGGGVFFAVETERAITDNDPHDILMIVQGGSIRFVIDGKEEATKITEGSPGIEDVATQAPLVFGKHPTIDAYFAQVVLRDPLLLSRALTPEEASLSLRELALRLSQGSRQTPEVQSQPEPQPALSPDLSTVASAKVDAPTLVASWPAQLEMPGAQGGVHAAYGAQLRDGAVIRAGDGGPTYALDGGAYVRIENDPAINFDTGNFTIDAEVTFQRRDTIEVFASMLDGAPDYNGWILRKLNDETIQFDQVYEGKGYSTHTLAKFGVGTYRITALRRNGVMEIWVNGTQQELAMTGGTPGIYDLSSDSPLIIGQISYSGAYPLQGTIRLALSRGALREADIRGSWNASVEVAERMRVEKAEEAQSAAADALAKGIIRFAGLGLGTVHSGEAIEVPGIGPVTVETSAGGGELPVTDKGIVVRGANVHFRFAHPIALDGVTVRQITPVDTLHVDFIGANGVLLTRVEQANGFVAHDCNNLVHEIFVSYHAYTPGAEYAIEEMRRSGSDCVVAEEAETAVRQDGRQGAVEGGATVVDPSSVVQTATEVREVLATVSIDFSGLPMNVNLGNRYTFTDSNGLTVTLVNPEDQGIYVRNGNNGKPFLQGGDGRQYLYFPSQVEQLVSFDVSVSAGQGNSLVDVYRVDDNQCGCAWDSRSTVSQGHIRGGGIAQPQHLTLIPEGRALALEQVVVTARIPKDIVRLVGDVPDQFQQRVQFATLPHQRIDEQQKMLIPGIGNTVIRSSPGGPPVARAFSFLEHPSNAFAMPQKIPLLLPPFYILNPCPVFGVHRSTTLPASGPN